ncbi:glycosyltransferase family 2 protein [Agromyces protaetiae]|uniref:Glycosyltransferase family 2 protein n=1 Tax=Agromyces protaetiae TaxID=2509455 RepID=A0A4P6FF03_9MICO|nr:glycosyltransferase family 2 protein [Agromyces protaetiae]QAY73623.1 glycosyltransferase family 2 protein [Agromyces protaetiae]
MPEEPAEATASSAPGVSYVMPVLNDASHVRQAVESILAQEVAGPIEVLIALGPSIDGTAELVADLAARDPRVRVLENEVGSTPAGLNIGIRAAQYPVVVRVDSHSVLSPRYTAIAVETLDRTGADNVGGVMAAHGETPFERAVALAYTTPVGLGGSSFHVGGSEGPAETVYLGVFRTAALHRVGLFDEEIKRGQDWELNRRIREQGGTVWFTPELSVTYRPRSSVERLARQMFSTGLWRGELARRFPASNGIRYFVPPAMVVGVVLGTLVGVAGIVQAIVGASPWLLLGFVVPAVYLAFLALATLVYARGADRATAWRFLLVLPCIHVSWGAGFILGYLSLAKNIARHTGR